MSHRLTPTFFQKIRHFKKASLLPKAKPHDVLIFDRKLLAHKQFSLWASQFSIRLAVVGGESAKSMQGAFRLLEFLSNKASHLAAHEMRLVVAGGGSLGDLCGFVASVWKRGVSWVNLPSTWLSAVDSSIGGKTGINWKGTKNQIGTFHPAKEIWLVEELLLLAPQSLVRDGHIELFKAHVIHSRRKTLQLVRSKRALRELTWQGLHTAMSIKMNLVQRDPFETTGLRRLLNFGHTLGHIVEASAKGKLSHGMAVALGLDFAIRWSMKRCSLDAKDAWHLLQHLEKVAGVAKQKKEFLPVPKAQMLKLLGGDKKRHSKGIQFVFLKAIGLPTLEVVSIEDVLAEATRQQWQ